MLARFRGSRLTSHNEIAKWLVASSRVRWTSSAYSFISRFVFALKVSCNTIGLLFAGGSLFM